jgi:transcriptional regulator with XRE-family HTH domain
MDLNRRIRTLRLRRGMTGMELARRSGVSPSYVSLIEHGEKTPSEDVAVRIARALGDREDVYRVWAATARMNEATRQAVWRLRGADRERQLLSRTTPPRSGEVELENSSGRASGAGAPAGFIEVMRRPGRPRVAEPFEFPVSHELADDRQTPMLRIPILSPGAAPFGDPPPPEDIEALVALDARLLDRSSAAGLVALRVDEANGREVATWLRPHDLVVLERRPHEFDPALLHAFLLPEGLRLARAALAPGLLVLLPDASRADPPLILPLGATQSVEQLLYGTVIWSSRLWPAP